MRRLPSSDEEEGEDGSPRARLQGLAAPPPEYWSDEEPGSTIWQAESASEPRRDRAAPAERKFGGPRLDEPLSWPLVGRLLFYTAALSLCLTSCEVLTMWVSLHVRWAISPRFLLGLVFCLNIENIRQFIQALSGTELFSAEIYFLTQLPAVVDPNEVTQVVLMGLGLSLLATLYPSWRAARTDPVVMLRNE
jgi:hypothetical protein